MSDSDYIVSSTSDSGGDSMSDNMSDSGSDSDKENINPNKKKSFCLRQLTQPNLFEWISTFVMDQLRSLPKKKVQKFIKVFCENMFINLI